MPASGGRIGDCLKKPLGRTYLTHGDTAQPAHIHKLILAAQQPRQGPGHKVCPRWPFHGSMQQQQQQPHLYAFSLLRPWSPRQWQSGVGWTRAAGVNSQSACAAYHYNNCGNCSASFSIVLWQQLHLQVCSDCDFFFHFFLARSLTQSPAKPLEKL